MLDKQIILEEVRRALDIRASVEANKTLGTPDPLFVELGQHVTTIFPSVQNIYDSLATIQRIWLSNGVDQILEATKPDETPLGQGTLTAQQLKDLQRVFKSLKVWIESPVVLEGDTEKPGPIPLVVISQRPK